MGVQKFSGALVLFAALSGAAPAAAQTDASECNDGSGERAIAACTRISENPGAETRIRAYAFSNRGAHYYRQRDYARAIADFSEATRLEAGYAVAYYNRGVAHQARGDRGRAVADYRKAIEIDPALQHARNALRGLGVMP